MTVYVLEIGREMLQPDNKPAESIHAAHELSELTIRQPGAKSWFDGLIITPAPPDPTGPVDMLRKKPGIDGTRRFDLLPMPLNDWLRFEPAHERIMEQRMLMLAEHPEITASCSPEAEGAAAELLQNIGAYLPAAFPGRFVAGRGRIYDSSTGREWPLHCEDGETALRIAGSACEEDFILMGRRGSDPNYRLLGHVACFPSDWSPGRELGKSISDLHASVPGMNEAVGVQIDGFLDHLKPHRPMERVNFLLYRNPALSLFPELRPADKPPFLGPPLEPGTVGETTFLRNERETLVRLPESGFVIFSIKIYVTPLAELSIPVKRHLAALLEAMPPGYFEEKKRFSPADQAVLFDYLRR